MKKMCFFVRFRYHIRIYNDDFNGLAKKNALDCKKWTSAWCLSTLNNVIGACKSVFMFELNDVSENQSYIL